ncbi:hypothetical protein GUJ93_ZPchr0013g37178 [Zizania palustris]|uniref:Uncharacterized protein n=1 Tax=Zizania palustris TaxID=103762 RepID=A0A8J5X362_ZIZPA|nr:hypothetical protein GUJ93_ZPchr0013g37178 [Zizania palustris]
MTASKNFKNSIRSANHHVNASRPMVGQLAFGPCPLASHAPAPSPPMPPRLALPPRAPRQPASTLAFRRLGSHPSTWRTGQEPRRWAVAAGAGWRRA